MSHSQHHPQYEEFLEDWGLLRDSYKGSRAIKRAGVKYLPPTPGHILDGMGSVTDVGYRAYEAYKLRAVYPDFFREGVATIIGILNAKDTIVNLPPEMEYLRERATSGGESLATVLRKVHQEQLITGRVGLLADMLENPSQANPEVYIQTYTAESITNWDDGSFNQGFNKLNLVVLDESGFERVDTFNWTKVEKFRVLSLGAIGENEPLGAYNVQIYDGSDVDTSTADVTPILRGRTLKEIPFVFIGPRDLESDPDDAPLLGLARLCLTVYLGEADYRHTLYMQAQDTLVIIGGTRGNDGPTNSLRVGAGARIDVEIGGDVKYVGIGSSGLPEQRQALEADRNQAAVRTGQLLAPGKMSMESGEALKTRVAAQTATLTSIAISSAQGLQKLLRIIARWHGADENVVKVIPNLDFTNVAIQGQDLVQLVTAKNSGYPLSYKTLFDIAADRGLTKNTFEEELKLIEADPKSLVDRAAALLAPPQANTPVKAAGGPDKTPVDVKPPSNVPKK
jgi:hypothetical protein